MREFLLDKAVESTSAQRKHAEDTGNFDHWSSIKFTGIK
jgi:hypothetical protein